MQTRGIGQQIHQNRQSTQQLRSLSRRRACSNCYRRRSRCDEEVPCSACKLHETESTCHKQGFEGGNGIPSSPIYSRACRNCSLRKKKCSRSQPCSACVSCGSQVTCYEERGKRKEEEKKEEAAKVSLLKIHDEKAETISPRACYNCWYRKNKCSKKKPCSSCIFHGCQRSCFKENEQASKYSKDQTKHSEKGSQDEMKKDIHSSISSRSSPHNKANIAAQSEDNGVNRLYRSPLFQSWLRFASIPNVERILSLAGNTELAADWPSIDKDVVQSILAKIGSEVAPEATELAYVYSLLGICAIALPSSHLYKRIGEVLQKENILIFKQETIELMHHATNYNELEMNESKLILECRVYNALAWICMHSLQPNESHYYSEQAIFSARLANILEGFSDDDCLYSNEEIHKRNLSRILVLEVFCQAEWNSVDSGIPSSMPRLPNDISQFIIARTTNQKESLPNKNSLWKMHSAIWVRNAWKLKAYIEREDDKDKYDQIAQERFDEKSLEFIKNMETDEHLIDRCTDLLKTKVSLADIENNLNDSNAARLHHAMLAARTTSNILRNTIAAPGMNGVRINTKLSAIALEAVYGLVNDLPKLITLQRSQFHFPAVNHFTGSVFETAMQTMLSTVNRLDVIQNDPGLVNQVCSLFHIIPKSCQMMNEYGLTGPISFALQSTFTAVPIDKPIQMIDNGWQIQPIIDEQLNSSNERLDDKKVRDDKYDSILYDMT